MSSIFETYTTDESLEKDGVWIDFDDLRILICRAGGANTQFKKTFQALAKPHRYQIQNNTMSEDQQDLLLAKAYSKSIIKEVHVKKVTKGKEEWVLGIPTPGGKIIEFNEENLINLLTSLPDFFSDVQDISKNISNFRQDGEEEDLKNLKSASSGT